ncbi:MAG TPA: response regulator [Chloroflexota bacterium]|nr:response regulator [Chloroflexota bacterium]
MMTAKMNQPDHGAKARRILIVEDDATLAGLMASVLSDAGYQPDVVPSPEHAQGQYDLVVADYLAPAYVRGEPWPYLEKLRALSKQGRILGCTGHQDALSDALAHLGVAAVTSKPFDVDTLVRTVTELIEQGQRVADASPIGPLPAGTVLAPNLA